MLENVYYINLKERTGRKSQVESELNDMGWKYQRFDAIKDENHGRVGCTMSHLKLLTMAKEQNLEYIVIVEDDIQFMRKQWYNDKIKDIMNQDFDVFLLAGNIRPPVRLTQYKDTFRISNSFTTTGYIVKNHYYDSLIQNVKEGLQLLQKDPGGQYNSNAIDCHWMRLQAVDKWYMILPRTITQRPVYSDIEKRFTNYNHLMLDKIERIPQDVVNIQTDKKYILLIQSCKKYYDTRAQKQINGWLKDLPSFIKYYHVIGDISIENNHIDNEKNIIYVKEKDDYINLSSKTYEAFKILTEKYDFEYVIKTDDDQKLIDDNFYNHIMSSFSKKYDYGGKLIDCPDHISEYYLTQPELINHKNIYLEKTLYANGRLIILSKKSILHYLTIETELKSRIIEDHALGYLLSEKYKNNLFYIDSDLYFKDFD